MSSTNAPPSRRRTGGEATTKWHVGLLARLTPRGAVRLRRRARPRAVERRWTGVRRTVAAALASAVLALSGLAFVEEIVDTEQGSRARAEESKLPAFVTDLSDVCEKHLLAPLQEHLLPWTTPLRTINGYGLFRVMTTRRFEIALEGSLDGSEWREYVFRWKPGPIERAPGFVAPHQPRLDWQMWFAALNPRGHVHWLEPLMLRILEGSDDVLALLGPDPFAGERPRQVRLRMDEYHFTTRAERAATGAWWRREGRGLLTPPVSLPEGRGAGEER